MNEQHVHLTEMVEIWRFTASAQYAHKAITYVKHCKTCGEWLYN